jgi:S-adenosylmethionine:tRNA ribosyltransferase-isomerase
MTTGTAPAPLDFDLPRELEAHDPPGRRDDVRLLASWGDGERLRHARAADLPDLLEPGDLLVVNTSATLPAALSVRDGHGAALRMHLSTPEPAGVDPRRWVVELRLPRGTSSLPWSGAEPGMRLMLPGGASARIVRPLFADARRLWVASLDLPGGDVVGYLGRHGEPIRYGRVARPWPVSAYQTVYALEPGSAEMPSAGRPLTPEILTRLVARGIGITPLVLHAGVSSAEDGEPPAPERFAVPAATAGRVAATRAGGGRVVAVGTTVVRALESAAGEDGAVRPGAGWTDLVVTPERGVRVVDGLLTGWHEPRASHLWMLEAVAGRPALERSYAAALDAGYRWHEFGDLHLILPDR